MIIRNQEIYSHFETVLRNILVVMQIHLYENLETGCLQ